MNEEIYLGDGLYASFDGWHFKLRAPRLGGDHEVYLKPDVFKTFVRFVKNTNSSFLEDLVS